MTKIKATVRRKRKTENYSYFNKDFSYAVQQNKNKKEKCHSNKRLAMIIIISKRE